MNMPDFEDDCLGCGEPLSGRQRRYCSPTCRKRYQRSKTPKLLRTCARCGQPFSEYAGRQKFCGPEDRDYYCDDLLSEEDDDRSARMAALAEAECEHCQTPVPYSGRGRPKRFCAPRCRTAFYRAQGVNL
jgi:endogenous inhibitor of DNA gyrase (YacG/DUF329 family)